MSAQLPTDQSLRIDHPLVLPLVPPERRNSVLLLWRLDARLADLARRAGEPALAQIRLRWWADCLAKLDVMAPPSEPLLAEVAQTLLAGLTSETLGALAEGWIAGLAGDDIGARGVALFGATASLLGQSASQQTGAAGAFWGQVDAMTSIGQWLPLPAAPRIAGLPKSLAVLTNDAWRLAAAGGVRRPRRDQLAMLRVGLLGR